MIPLVLAWLVCVLLSVTLMAVAGQPTTGHTRSAWLAVASGVFVALGAICAAIAAMRI